METLSRRFFLKNAAIFSVPLAGFSWTRNIFASAARLQFPTQPRERLAVSSWPFRALIDSPANPDRDHKQPGMDLKDFPAMVADKFNLRKIEPIGDHFRSTDLTYLQEFRQAMQKVGVTIINIPVTVGASLYDLKSSQRRKGVENARKWVDIAVTLGSPSIQVNIQPLKSLSPDVERTAESLRSIVNYAAPKDVIVNLENDNLVSEDAFFLVKVIERLNHPYLRALPDFCNSMLNGNERFNDEAVSAMFKHAYNISHVKDSEVGPGGRLFKVDIRKMFAIAKACGYRGYFSMEWEGEGQPFEGTRRLIEESLQCLS